MTTWPIGVFASIDAGLGVQLDVARELGVPTIQVHAPHAETRNPKAASAFLKKCSDAGISVTAVSAISSGPVLPMTIETPMERSSSDGSTASWMSDSVVA